VADGSTLTAIKVSDPSHGTLDTFNADGSFTYTPAANYNGDDSFTYKANDGLLDSIAATVSITVTAVNDVPVATDDSYSTSEDVTLNVAATGVLGNDVDIDSTITAVKITDPAHGTLTLNADGSFEYIPSPSWYGTDTFTYKANDGILDSNIATVTITINEVYEAPVADFTSTPSGLTVQFTSLFTGDWSSCAWDFENDGIVDSSDPNPSHTYPSAGTFTVKLTVTGPGGSDDQLSEITLNGPIDPPTAVPEFPSVALPAALIVGLLGAVFFLKSSKED
ncbi:MAG: Ig-like domain-containing protein, partial [Methanoregula sp.]|nr:Ig-like domain-containing protein [Methanoregula sp.]